MAQRTENPGNAGLATAWQDLERSLDERRQKIAAEISAYPAPIAGCDAQFNALLDERRQITEKLRDLREAHRGADAEDCKKQTQSSLNI